MASNGKLTLFYMHHCYEHEGEVTLWFYDDFDREAPDPSEDPAATKLVGPTSPGEALTIAKAVRLVMYKLGREIVEEHGADD